MLRRSQEVEEENTERWLVSYADFITLLFAFFVVMYSISQVNEGKYRILSESLVSAFETPAKSKLPIQQGQINQSQTVAQNSTQQVFSDGGGDEKIDDEQEYLSSSEFDQIEQQLTQQLEDLIDNELVSIKRTKNWLEVDLTSALLFQSGSDRLTNNAKVIIAEVAATLRKNRQIVVVRGHTDNIPIETDLFSSNWSLSAARAVAVVRLLQSNLIVPERLLAQGHGEFKPVASNDTAEGRAKNRRVTLAISRYAVAESAFGTEPANEEASDTVDSKIVDAKSEQKTQDSETPQAKDVSEESEQPKYEVIKLPGGGLLIRGKKLPDEKKKDEN
ncbi:MAG: flagellar motor protein MotD [Gammaproteobacteria bacterium]|nr:flagellar motor protein MotD [Gammaproteobacteria bacterium]